ncbi:MAG: hypothetical protein PHS95_03010 [Candidatus Pacebacteria bacterium]|nr:hypothetical protein [Candidatus Paceibacterota bacterium]
METLVKADIFFFITSVAVVVVTVILVWGGFYFLKTLKNIRDISDKFKNAVNMAEDDFESIHDQITQSIIYKFLFRKKRKDANNKNSK